MLIRVDLEALKRGAVEGDELCDIPGLGPIAVSAARELLGESILKLVITKGVDVVNVTHLGRGPTEAQRIALLFQQPGCTVEGCHRTRCEIDHRHDWARTHHTRVDECDPLCKPHHDLKTYQGWALVEGTGKRRSSRRTDPPTPPTTTKPTIASSFTTVGARPVLAALARPDQPADAGQGEHGEPVRPGGQPGHEDRASNRSPERRAEVGDAPRQSRDLALELSSGSSTERR